MTNAQAQVHRQRSARDAGRTCPTGGHNSGRASSGKRERSTDPRKAAQAQATRKVRKVGSQEEGRLAVPATSRPRCFINLPFSSSYEDVLLSHLNGLIFFRIDPKLVLLNAGGLWRLPRLNDTIRSCAYSIHDLSWNVPADVRYNMPFELGLAVSAELESDHRVIVFESKRYRLEKRLSDLNGVDPCIHQGMPTGVLRELWNLFGSAEDGPGSLSDLKRFHRTVKAWKNLPGFRRHSLFEPAFLRKSIVAIGEITQVHFQN
jgi:hypothetical protein